MVCKGRFLWPLEIPTHILKDLTFIGEDREGKSKSDMESDESLQCEMVKSLSSSCWRSISIESEMNQHHT